MPDHIIADRYGRADRDPARTRRGLTVALLVFVVLAVGLAAWAALARGRTATWIDLGVTVRDDSEATVAFQVGLPADRQAVCTVRVVNAVHADVGRRDVTVGPDASGLVRTEVTLRTSERATAGGVRDCTLR